MKLSHKEETLLPMSDDIAVAKNVLNIEIKGLQALQAWLGQPFVDAVDILFNRSGRIVVSGMGKSGHVARKIAATFASTGTPAQFVHPGEASHGDLGMITKKDAVILLSNSGETKELRDIIYYTRRFSIPLIGMVRRNTSALVDASDVALILPDTPEACTVNAPTTSTTMMLALGDALAVALLERRGFDTEAFFVFHPGGKLGSSLLKVSDVMHTSIDIPLVKEETKMSEVLVEMTAKRFGCAGVVNKKGDLVGIITDGDLRRHMSPDITSKPAHTIMTREPKLVQKKHLVSHALKIMQKHAITTVFIVEEKKPVGILHIHDILREGTI